MMMVPLQWFVFLSSLFYVVEGFHAGFLTPQKLGRPQNRLRSSPSNVATEQANDDPANTPIRLNKVFKATHSRREADNLVQEGRVAVNGVVSMGCMVVPFVDQVTLDGEVVQGWEGMNGLSQEFKETKELSKSHYEYVKYYKPRGIICTTDQRIKNNIIFALTKLSQFTPKHRVFPVGRLDKDSSGLIVITSDGRLPNASLRFKTKQPKVYQVTVDKALTEEIIDQLSTGVVITTVAQHNQKPLTAPTQPCRVQWVAPTKVLMTLQEGRNRQIRKMMAALGYEVTRLHRVAFGEIRLDRDMKPGDWKRLSAEELAYVHAVLEQGEHVPEVSSS